jgi:hypothetical protein
MLKPWVAAVILCLLSQSASAQSEVRSFEFVPSERKVPHSLYDKITFLDTRKDTSSIGLIYVGLLKNIDARLVLKTPVQPQLVRLVDSLTDSTAKDGELLFQLRRFRFNEIIGTRYCYLNAALYSKSKGQFRRISVLDTVMAIRYTDIAKDLALESNRIILDFLADGILLEPTDSLVYTLNDLENIDSVEKLQIPVYGATSYVEGVYFSYSSFKMQTPDKQGFVNMDGDGTIGSVRILDSSGKKVKIKSKDIFALVYKGLPYVATDFGYYPLQKISGDFYFIGDVKMAAGAGDAGTGDASTGILSAAIASGGSRQTYQMIIDHQNGRFIHVRAIRLN